MELNFEQLAWLLTLRPSESWILLRKLASGAWKLVWNAEMHAYELVPVA